MNNIMKTIQEINNNAFYGVKNIVDNVCGLLIHREIKSKLAEFQANCNNREDIVYDYFEYEYERYSDALSLRQLLRSQFDEAYPECFTLIKEDDSLVTYKLALISDHQILPFECDLSEDTGLVTFVNSDGKHFCYKRGLYVPEYKKDCA